MQEWHRFVVQLRARTSDRALLWSVDLADALAKRMSTMDRPQALAVAAVVYRGMSEALHVDPVELFGLLAQEGYMGNADVTVIHVANPECDCERCVAAQKQDNQEMN